MKHIFKRELAAFLAAAVVLGSILAGATHYLTPQQHDYGSVWGMYEQEQTDSIDVLFFGSSVTYCDVVPAVYWENSGLTAFVQAGPEQPLPLTLDYLKESLRTQSPKAVFVECTGIAFHKYMGFTKTNIGQMPWGINRLHATFFNAEPEVRKGLLFPLYFYHDRWTTLKSEDVQPYTEDMLAGYTFLSGGTDKGPDDCETVDIAPEDWERNMDALEDIYALCRRNNIQLVLYRAPTKRLHDADWGRLTAQFDGRDGVSTLNCSDYTAQIAADPENDFYDSLHYNCVGAEKFSAFLADWTKNNLSISPDEPQDTVLWTARLQHFRDLTANPPQENTNA